MTNTNVKSSSMTIGLDVGDRRTHFCVLDADREPIARDSFRTTSQALSKELSPFRGARVVLEAGSQSPWMSRQLRAEGFDVHTVDPRRVQLISTDPRKTDRRDAEMLARLESAMPEVLGNIYHRGPLAQADLAVVRARDLLVRMRAMAIHQARSLCKAFGRTLPPTSTRSFASRTSDDLPAELRPALNPVLNLIDELTARVRDYERTLSKIVEQRYPQAQLLQQVQGVGPVTTAAFILTIEDPARFTDSRRVGSWLGLCPRSRSSGDSNPQLRISKAGDAFLRRLLLQCAHFILARGEDSDLKRFGTRLAARGGRAAKKRAAVAVARKLAVLLHRLWRNGLVYEPLHHSERQEAA